VPRRGVILIVVSAVLGVLAVLATCFITLARLERQASQRRLLSCKAFLLARSGLEDARARLDAGQDPSAVASRHGTGDWRFQPSFWKRAGDAPVREEIEGRGRGLSGALDAGSYALQVDTGGLCLNGGDPSQPASSGYNAVLRRILGTYAEAMQHEGAPVDRSDGESLVDFRPSGGWCSWDEVRLLALGGSREKLEAVRPDLTLAAWMDLKVIRPNATQAMAGEYQTWADIKLGRSDLRFASIARRGAPGFEEISGRVVGRAPVDFRWARTRRPVLIALLAGLKGLYLDESTAQYAAAPGTDAIGNLRAAELVLDWSLPTDDCRQAADLILASPLELRTWVQWDAFCDVLDFPSLLAVPGTAAGDAASALAAAQAAFDAARTAFSAAFQAVVDAYAAFRASERAGNPDPMLRDRWLQAGRARDLAQAESDRARDALAAARSANDLAQAALGNARFAADVLRSLLKSNFNPNSDLNKFNPDPSLHRHVDKADLLVYSTEWDLAGLGSTRIRSAARIADSRGRLAAARELGVEIRAPRAVRLTTQAEFVAGDLGRPEQAGDEGAFRSCGEDGFLSASRGAGSTYARRWLAGAVPGMGRGVSLQTAPEPPQVWEGGGSGRPADYDGQIRLATIETGEREHLDAAGRMMFLAGWGRSLRADVGGGSRNAVPDGEQPPEGVSAWDASAPGVLYPDGLYVERGRQVGYEAPGSMEPHRGVLSFWFKPSYDIARLGGVLSRMHALVNNTRLDPFNGNATAAFLLQQSFWFELGGFSMFTENICAEGGSDDDGREQVRNLGRIALAPHRWHLVTYLWDMDQPVGDLGSRILLDRGLLPEERNTPEVYNAGFVPAEVDFTRQGPGPAVFRLGRLQQGVDFEADHSFMMTLRMCGAPDATFDEFAIYDVGSEGQVSVNRAETLARKRFEDGRCYKESTYGGLEAPAASNLAGRWLSAPLDLGSSRILRLAWTAVVPVGLRRPLPDVAGTAEDSDPGEEGRILLELADLTGRRYLEARDGGQIRRMFSLPEGDGVGRVVDRPFRISAVFQPNLEDLLEKAVLEPLVLDDLTVVYRPLSEPEVLSWEEP